MTVGKEVMDKSLYWDSDPASTIKVLVGLNKELGINRPYGITLRQIGDDIVLCCQKRGRKIVASEEDGLRQAFSYLQENKVEEKR